MMSFYLSLCTFITCFFSCVVLIAGTFACNYSNIPAGSGWWTVLDYKDAQPVFIILLFIAIASFVFCICKIHMNNNKSS